VYGKGVGQVLENMPPIMARTQPHLMAASCELNGGGKDGEKDLVGMAILNKIIAGMAAMTIEDEESVTQLRFGFCTSIKKLFKPG
jgi:hypothetical protein